ncbi:MAG: exonuclease subunit SbcD, partial [Clostridiales bacterium]|nr:exonuclease subunit SbcD [Clostridiales bacterium]
VFFCGESVQMKIIHTSDWHLGKRLEGVSRLKEQQAALESLLSYIKKEKIDAVVVAGDVFDTMNPPAEAESLFYAAALEIGKNCPLIAIAGNHDNAERLSAPSGIAAACNVALIGGMDNRRFSGAFTGGEGHISLHRNGELVNFAVLPYPSPARMSALGYTEKADGSYAESVRAWLSICAQGFTKTDCNITVSHLFMNGSVRATDEAELGTAALLPISVLPQAHYTALGHVHKPQKIKGVENAYYSGSLLAYSFDDTSEKFFNLVETSPVSVKVTQLPVSAGKKLVTASVKSFDECERALEENEGAYVRILYDSPEPLSAAKYASLRAHENFVAFKNVFISPKRKEAQLRRHRTDTELFCDFYKETKGEDPKESLVALFEQAMRGEEL